MSHGAAQALRVAGWISLAVLAACALVPRRWIYVPTNMLVAFGSLFIVIQLVRIAAPPVHPVAIDLPFRGEWYVFSAGRSALINDHFPTVGQRHAIDLFQEFPDGSTHHGDKERLSSYPSFGRTLLAPVDGRVVTAVDTFPDLTPGKSDKKHAEGNYLVIDMGDGRYVAMAHLKQGSVEVSVGDNVQRGQPVAEVGNTGNTGLPHLHIQVSNLPKLASPLAGLHTYPILFRDAVVRRGGGEYSYAEADVRRNDRVRRTGP